LVGGIGYSNIFALLSKARQSRQKERNKNQVLYLHAIVL
jgi:hypothetical protein